MKKFFSRVVLVCLIIFYIIILTDFVSAELIEVGSKDVSFLPVSADKIVLQNSGVQPSFSLNTVLLGNSVSQTLNITPLKQGSALSLTHSVMPFGVSNFRPSDYYYSIDSNLQDSGQFVKFLLAQPVERNRKVFVAGKVVDETFWVLQNNFVEWNFGDKNEIVFDANHVFSFPFLYFNSLARDFSKETLSGKFKPYKISINKNIVSLVFVSTVSVPQAVPVVLNDLITQSTAVCNAPDQNTTWLSTNTYFVNADLNVDVSNCQLTIQAGAVVKYKVSNGVYLNITNKGVLKAQGTQANKIVFTSRDDNSVGTKVGSSDGVPTGGDYYNAIFLNVFAGITSDANVFNDLNFSYAQTAIRFSRLGGYGVIRDNNFSNNNNTTGSAQSCINLVVGTLNFVSGNTFFGNKSGYASGFVVAISGSSVITNFYNNVFKNNTDTGNCYGALYNASTITNFFGNNFSNNSCSYGSGAAFGNEGTITSIHDNNFSNNSASDLGATIYNGNLITDFYSNIVSNNTATGSSGTAGIANAGTIANIFDNNFFGNTGYAASVLYDFGGGTISRFSGNKITNNTVADAAGAGGLITLYGTYATNFFDNNVSSNTLAGEPAIFSAGGITNFFNNKFFDNSGSTATKGGVLYNNGGNIENLFNNLFVRNTGFSGTAIFNEATIANLFNNAFVANKALDNNCAGIDNNNGGTISNLYNNTFVLNKNTAICNMASTINSNFNAFFGNDKNFSGYTEGTQSVFLGATPFIDVGNDRNFLLNSYGITQLQGRGNSAIGTDSFFTAKTVRYDNRLDYNRTIGYHYDQNSPHFNLLTNLIGTYKGNITLDFNISTATSNLATFSLLIKAINQFYDQNHLLYSGNTSNICSGTYPSLGKDLNCRQNWATICNIEDLNYKIFFNISDANGAVAVLSNSILIDNNFCSTTTAKTAALAAGMAISNNQGDWLLPLVVLIIVLALVFFFFRKNAV